MADEKFIMQHEDIAGAINGETPGGEQMQLGDDVLIFSKLLVFEQPVLNRLRKDKESGKTLYDEVVSRQGVFYLGEIEAVKAELHANVDKMFEAILAYRKSVKEQNEKQTETK